LRKLAEQPELHAIVLAAAGLERLHFRNGDAAEISGEDVPKGLLARAISVEEMLPCVGQAAIGIEIRENDPRLERICTVLNHTETRACVAAERAFLRAWAADVSSRLGLTDKSRGSNFGCAAFPFWAQSRCAANASARFWKLS